MLIELCGSAIALDNKVKSGSAETWVPLVKSGWMNINSTLKTTVAKTIFINGLVQSNQEDTRVWRTSLNALARTTGVRKDIVLKGLKELEDCHLIRLLGDSENENQPTNQPYTVDELCQDKSPSTPRAKKLTEDQELFIDVYNLHCGDRPKKKQMLSDKEKRKIDEIIDTFDESEINKALKTLKDVDDSGWTSGRVSFQWLLRGDHFERLVAGAYKMKTREKINWL